MSSKNNIQLFNKSYITNLSAGLVVLLSLFLHEPVLREVVANIGFFALSGALTNWIAVYMLFEKVPGFYGSGVIQTRFVELKKAIKALIQEQFFTPEYIQSLVDKQQESFITHAPRLAKSIDYNVMFRGLIDAIMGSSFGSMIQMVGGEKALLPLQPKFEQKMQEAIETQLNSPVFQEKLKQVISEQGMTSTLMASLEAIVDDRLEKMTPQIVKKLMKDIMHQHLGWLVVWGGVFGGLLGCLKSLMVLL